MTDVQKAVLWAATMLALALGAAGGFIETESAMALIAVIPAIAITTMRSKGCCNIFTRFKS